LIIRYQTVRDVFRTRSLDWQNSVECYSRHSCRRRMKLFATEFITAVLWKVFSCESS